MQYLLLIYGNEGDWASMSEEEQTQIFQEYMEYSQKIAGDGKMVGGEALEPSDTATTVRVRDGKTLATDGPFAETREQLGGYYQVEADNLDEAIALAAQIPGAKHGAIEVRPILPTPRPE